jgi:N6-adenosine-specific RNA methylase IME4
MQYQGVIPDQKYGCIVADPPWPGGKTIGAFGHSRRGWRYQQMPIPELESMSILLLPRLQDNAHLWMWTTNMFLVSGVSLNLCKVWGFTPRSILTWDKELMGLGRWLRGQTEHCILATRGSVSLAKGLNLRTLIRERRRAHSQKPEAFWKYPETLSPGPRLELFARCERPGWTSIISEQASSVAATIAAPSRSTTQRT